MPGFDGTGPMGRGSMSGRGRGYCAVNVSGAVSESGAGRMFGRGRKQCWGRIGRMAPVNTGRGSAVSREEELSMLKLQADDLNAALAAVQARVQALEHTEERG